MTFLPSLPLISKFFRMPIFLHQLKMRYLLVIFIYFIFIFFLLTRRKATEVLIRRASNYPDLLPEMPRYCGLVHFFFFSLFWFYRDMIKIRTTYQDRKLRGSVIKCLSQVHSRISRVGFELKPCRSQSRHLSHSTKLPTNMFFFIANAKSLLYFVISLLFLALLDVPFLVFAVSGTAPYFTSFLHKIV